MRTGGCQCGEVRYQSSGEPLALYVCHCRECRRQSASAFGLSLAVPAAGFTVTRGTPKVWTRPTDSGRLLACSFCPSCGSRLWHQRPGPSPTLTIKAAGQVTVDAGGMLTLKSAGVVQVSGSAIKLG